MKNYILALPLLLSILGAQNVPPPPKPSDAAGKGGAKGPAQNVPSPPKPADNGPSLEVTMQFIQDKITEEDKLSYTASVSDLPQPGAAPNPDLAWTNQFTVEITNFVADAKACRISFHWLATQNGQVSDDTDYSLPLKDVRAIAVMPQEQNQKQVDMRNGHANWDSKITPSLFTLVVRRPKGVENAVVFSDEAMAGRVAKAIVHAVELCGGGKEDPF